MNRRHLWFWRKPVRLRFAENQKECMNSPDRTIERIVQLSVIVSTLFELLHAFRCAGAQIIESPKYDRFGWTDLCARGHQPALLPVITKRALESAARIGQRFWPAINYAEGAGDNAISAAVANIVLHENRADFSPHD